MQPEQQEALPEDIKKQLSRVKVCSHEAMFWGDQMCSKFAFPGRTMKIDFAIQGSIDKLERIIDGTVSTPFSQIDEQVRL